MLPGTSSGCSSADLLSGVLPAESINSPGIFKNYFVSIIRLINVTKTLFFKFWVFQFFVCLKFVDSSFLKSIRNVLVQFC